MHLLISTKYTQMDTINNFDELEALASQFGDGFYVVFPDRIRKVYWDFFRCFCDRYDKVEIAYSVKTCSIRSVLNTLKELGAAAEVVSEHEYEIAREIGFEDSKIVYNGPYKDMKLAVDISLNGGRVNLDSLSEVERFCTERKKREDLGNIVLQVGLRCNFSVDERGSRFGIDITSQEIDMAIQMLIESGIAIRGFMCHIRARDLEHWRLKTDKICTFAKSIIERWKLNDVEYIDLGGGYKYNPEMFPQYAALISDRIKNTIGGSLKLILEPGAVISETVVDYVAKVVNINMVGNKKYATLAATISDISAIRKKVPGEIRIIKKAGNITGQKYRVTLAGFTCMEDDIIADDIQADIQVGDFVYFSYVGAYSSCLRPDFIRKKPPVLVFENAKGIYMDAE